jgi:hypothetical protein
MQLVCPYVTIRSFRPLSALSHSQVGREGSHARVCRTNGQAEVLQSLDQWNVTRMDLTGPPTEVSREFRIQQAAAAPGLPKRAERRWVRPSLSM